MTKAFLEVRPDEERLAISVNVAWADIAPFRQGGAWPDGRPTPRWKLHGSEMTDLVPVDDGLNVFSPRAREILDRYAIGGDIDWLDVEIEDRHGVVHSWAAFRWGGPPIPLNADRSTFAPDGRPVKRVYRWSAVAGRHVFAERSTLQMLIVSDVVWAALTDQGATGMVVRAALVH